MSAWGARWWNLWFAPQGPGELGLHRAVFCGGVLAWYARTDFSAWADVAPVFWAPAGLFAYLHLPLASPGALAALQLVWKLALALACVGLFTRVSLIIAAALGAYLIGLQHCFGKVSHAEGMLVLALAVLASARAQDAWSIDAWRAKRERAPSGDYRWPLQLIRFALCLVFFSAGASKLLEGGWSWVTSDHLQLLLLRAATEGGALSGVQRALGNEAWLCHAVAAATVAVELAYPLSFFDRRARWLFVPAMIGLLVAIKLLLGPSFPQLVWCQLFWVPWARVASKAAARAPQAEPTNVGDARA